VFKSSKALGDFVTELNKGTTPFNKYLTSSNPKIEYPNFLIGVIKKTLMSNKYNKYENSGHPRQNQHRQNNGGFNKFANQQQYQQMAYAHMMNQMPMMPGMPQGFAPMAQVGYPTPQPFPQGPITGHWPQGQFRQPNVNPMQNFAMGPNARGPFPPQPQAKLPLVCNSLADINKNRQSFDSLQNEEKLKIYKRLIIQKLTEVPELVKQLANKNRPQDHRQDPQDLP
jgi:hypothetical protein